jgi:hypothetical protein
MDDIILINLIRVVAEKHKCKITGIDMENHCIMLDGPDDAQIACAQELADILQEVDCEQNISGS